MNTQHTTKIPPANTRNQPTPTDRALHPPTSEELYWRACWQKQKAETEHVTAQRDELLQQIGMSVTRSRMVAEMDKNQIRQRAKLEILRLVETDINATISAITNTEQTHNQ